ncbi:MAG: PIG-L family deacetylase [Flavobacteriales bacterium]|nr:PIG-L family deacetylase [Flavobacteriales bacterium]
MAAPLRYLYIFPHPDDESFGPAGAIHQQVRAGHEVHLLTLTRGGATQARIKLGLGVEEMGAVRYNEMQDVARVLGLSSMTVLDHPDSGLKELDPRMLEHIVAEHITQVRPQVLVTYPVHGGSGFHDHLVTHAVVNRVFLDLRDQGHSYLKRLAYFTMPDSGAPSILPDGWPRLKLTEAELIDCVVPLAAEDVDAMKRALLCYATYQETVRKMGVIEKIGDKVHFEIAYENFAPPLTDLGLSLN